MDDLISRKAAIDALAEDMPQPYTPDGSHPADEGIFMAQEIYADCIQTLKELPSVKLEPAIPLQWIEAHIEWLKSLDNAFSTLTAVQISTMVNKWKYEQDE